MTDRPLIHIHIPKTAGMAIVKTLGYNSRYKHLGHPFPAGQIKAGKISQLVWEIGIKFTVVRDPLDRLASLYFYMKHRMAETPKDLADFFYNYIPCRTYTYNYGAPQVCWLEMGMDHILHYHNLEKDWLKFCRQVGLPYRPLRPQNIGKGRLQTNALTDTCIYHHMYDDKLKAAVRYYYREDYDQFSFPGDLP